MPPTSPTEEGLGVGLDFSQPMLEAARERFVEGGAPQLLYGVRPS